jgi:hypothetical protein
MSKPVIIRKSFNGGEIAPELWFRSDLEAFQNSCKSILNMNVTPWGAAERRPPTELLAKIDVATYGVPVKYLPFKFSSTEAFHLVFTDGSGSASPSSATADLIIFDAAGAMVTLAGASTLILDTVYDPDDLINLHYIGAYDYIYMTCGGSYPTQAINRFYDAGQSGNRWTVGEYELNFGPFDEQNLDVSHTMSINVSAYDAGTTYAAGDVVSGSVTIGGTVAINAVHAMPIDDILSQFLIQTSAPHGFVGGESVTLAGLPTVTFHSITFSNSSVSNLRAGNFALNNTYRVGQVYSATTFGIGEFAGVQSGTTFNNVSNANLWQYPIVTDQSSNGMNYKAEFVTRSVAVTGSIGAATSTIEATFVSLQSSNVGNALSNAAYWQVGGATTGVQAATADVVSSKDVFVSADVGRLLAVQDISDERLRGSWGSDQSSNPVNAYGTVTLKTEGGAWSGLLELQQSTDNLANWETLGSIRSVNGESNGSIERTITGSTNALRVRLTDWATPSGSYATKKCVWELSFVQDIFQLLKITAVTDAQNATVETISPLLTSLSSARWKFGEFGSARGYPRTLTIHDERLTLGGNVAKPNTIWASRVNDWNNLLPGDTDLAAYTFTVKSDSFDAVQWIRSTRELMIGTENSESTMGTMNDSEVISATNVKVKTHTYFGSANIQAVVTADLVFFVQDQKKRVRSSQYDFGTDQYLSSEMSIYAHHITDAGIKEMTFSRDPYSSLFFVMADGKAVTFTYERENAVKGWARIEMGGSASIISAASNFTPVGDSVFGIIQRNGEYTLEGFKKNVASTVYLDGQIQFVDDDYSAGVAVPINSTGAVVVRNDVQLAEGDYTIAGGTLTIPGHTDGTVTIGWPVSFEIVPTNPLEFGDFGVIKRCEAISVYLLNSGGCDVDINGITSPFQDSINLAATARLDGEYSLEVSGDYSTKVEIKLSGNHHKPFKLTGLGYNVSRHT